MNNLKEERYEVYTIMPKCLLLQKPQLDTVCSKSSKQNRCKTLESEAAINDLKLFSKFVKYVSFVPFKDAQDALGNINDISEGIVNETLKNFLELNLPKVKEG